MADAVERRVRRCLEAGDVRGAARISLDSYGAELYGFLVAAVDDAHAARTLYADVNRRIASELESFRWRCSLRTWMYGITRRELADRRTRRRPSAHSSQPGTMVDPEVTISRRPTGLAGIVATLRRVLREEDRELLILRVDRGLSWTELAVTSLGEDASRLDVAREAERLRGSMTRIVSEIEQAAAEYSTRSPR